MLRVKILLQRGGEAVGVHEALKRQRDDGIALRVAQLRRVRLCRAEQKLRRPRFDTPLQSYPLMTVPGRNAER